MAATQHKPRFLIMGENLSEFIHNAVYRYVTLRAAARGIGIPYSTLRTWMKDRFQQRSAGFDERAWLLSMRATLDRASADIEAAYTQLDELSEKLGIARDTSALDARLTSCAHIS